TATVSVRIVRASYDKVQVSGAVNRPGLIRIGAGDKISLNDALLRAGGLRPSAQGAKVRIVKDGLLSAVALSLQGEEYSLVTDEGLPIVPDVSLDNNDVAFVFASQRQAPDVVGEKEVTVLGEVRKSGIYRFSGSEACTMMHLMFKMGGLPPYANKKVVEIHRQDENGVESVLKINVEDLLETGNPAQDVPLENGDRIVVRRRKIHLF
ncbi:MAG: SLBB domain-containing protein, partial [Lentisphaerae bacterium]|nr:SLBB domain-containing protein [Lentisphaerota bacterium]